MKSATSFFTSQMAWPAETSKKQSKSKFSSIKEDDLEKCLPLAKETGAGIIALTLDEKGVPNTVEGRIEIAARILITAESAGIPPEHIYLDPVVLPINVAQDQPKKLLETIGQFKLLSSPPPHM
ncbi:MAG: dihydropteroate synthase, partial [Candidatus Erginobacter occultus]|nr:dihydropteroate synthase [Candidatus Erginobacter occultus]